MANLALKPVDGDGIHFMSLHLVVWSKEGITLAAASREMWLTPEAGLQYHYMLLTLDFGVQPFCMNQSKCVHKLLFRKPFSLINLSSHFHMLHLSSRLQMQKIKCLRNNYEYYLKDSILWYHLIWTSMQ